MSHTTLMNEDFPARIEAIFPDRESAGAAARALCQKFEFCEEQFSIVSPDGRPPLTHQNRYTFRASGRRLQKRQLTATLAAFVIVGAGLALLDLTQSEGLPGGITYTLMTILIIVAVAITASGLIAWRPARVETQHKNQSGEAVLIINVHDLSEQYALRDAVLDMGGHVEGAVSASVT